MAEIRNLTSHPVQLLGGGMERLRRFEPAAPHEMARADIYWNEVDEIDGVRTLRMTMGTPKNLPAPREGVWLIVSSLTAQAAEASDRTTMDLLVPAKMIFGENGPVGCRALSIYGLKE